MGPVSALTTGTTALSLIVFPAFPPTEVVCDLDLFNPKTTPYTQNKQTPYAYKIGEILQSGNIYSHLELFKSQGNKNKFSESEKMDILEKLSNKLTQTQPIDADFQDSIDSLAYRLFLR